MQHFIKLKNIYRKLINKINNITECNYEEEIE